MILNIRVTDAKIKTGEDENDYIFSPVFPFYNSKDHTKYPNMPKNSDSNGAYNISRKGLLILAKINEGSKNILVSNKDWFDFVQKENH